MHFLPILLLTRLFRGVAGVPESPWERQIGPFFSAHAPKRPFLNASTYSTKKIMQAEGEADFFSICEIEVREEDHAMGCQWYGLWTHLWKTMPWGASGAVCGPTPGRPCHGEPVVRSVNPPLEDHGMGCQWCGLWTHPWKTMPWGASGAVCGPTPGRPWHGVPVVWSVDPPLEDHAMGCQWCGLWTHPRKTMPWGASGVVCGPTPGRPCHGVPVVHSVDLPLEDHAMGSQWCSLWTHRICIKPKMTESEHKAVVSSKKL